MPEKCISRREALLAVGVAIAVPGMADAASARPMEVIRLKPQVRYQQLEGWGVSLAWWAHVVGAFPERIRRHYMDCIFNPVRGLGLTVVRYNIGGGENPKYHFIQYRAAVPGFSPRPGVFNWHADKGQITILRQAMAMGATRTEAFCNSPPYYMTQSGSVTGAVGGGDNLRQEAQTAFANYLAVVAAHFRRNLNIRFQTLEAFNEPVSHWWKFGNYQEGCHIGDKQQNILIPLLASAIKSHGLNASIAAPDDNSIDETLRSWRSYSPRTRALIYQINTHSYNGSDRAALRNAAAQAGKHLWMSEYGDGDATGMQMARRILQDMRELRPAAWVYWQAVDSARGWGFMFNPLNGSATEFNIHDKYHVMAAFSRFFRPGCRFIFSSSADTLAAIDERQRTVTVALLNDDHHERRFTLDLTPIGSGRWHAEIYQFTVGENPLRQTRLIGAERHIHLALPPRSVYTIQVSRG